VRDGSEAHLPFHEERCFLQVARSRTLAASDAIEIVGQPAKLICNSSEIREGASAPM
jgi:hypothetical protein